MEILYHLILSAVKIMIIHFVPNLFASPQVSIKQKQRVTYYIINWLTQKAPIVPNPTLIPSIVDNLAVDLGLKAIVEESQLKEWLWPLTPLAAFLHLKSPVLMMVVVLVLGTLKVSHIEQHLQRITKLFYAFKLKKLPYVLWHILIHINMVPVVANMTEIVMAMKFKNILLVVGQMNTPFAHRLFVSKEVTWLSVLNGFKCFFYNF